MCGFVRLNLILPTQDTETAWWDGEPSRGRLQKDSQYVCLHEQKAALGSRLHSPDSDGFGFAVFEGGFRMPSNSVRLWPHHQERTLTWDLQCTSGFSYLAGSLCARRRTLGFQQAPGTTRNTKRKVNTRGHGTGLKTGSKIKITVQTGSKKAKRKKKGTEFGVD